MIYKAGSRFRISKEWFAWGNNPKMSRNGTVIRARPGSDQRRVLRDGLRTPETWHVNWFTREHK